MTEENFVSISGNYPYRSLDLLEVEANVSISVVEEERTVVSIIGPKSKVEAIKVSVKEGTLVIHSEGQVLSEDVYSCSPSGVKYVKPELQIRLGKDVEYFRLQKPKGDLRLHCNTNCGLTIHLP